MRNRGYTYRAQVGPGDVGRTVLEYLAAAYRHTGAEGWRGRVAGGEVEVDGATAAPGDLLRPGAWVAWHRPPWDEPEVPRNFSVLLEDDAVVAVAKPSGLPTAPAGGFLEHTLLAFVRAVYPEAAPMHRLGRATSGVVLFAREPAARAALQEAFRARRIEKRYRALCVGAPASDVFTVEAPIGPVPHPLLGTVHAASSTGKQARSRVSVLERREGTSLLAVDIDTGRPHQIRIHLAHAGHPLAGDPLYGPGGMPLPGSRALPGDPGYLLHAERLGFSHPTTGLWTVVSAPCPPPLTTTR